MVLQLSFHLCQELIDFGISGLGNALSELDSKKASHIMSRSFSHYSRFWRHPRGAEVF